MSLNKLTMKKEFVFAHPKCGVETYIMDNGEIGIRRISVQKRILEHIEIKGVHLRTSQK